MHFSNVYYLPWMNVDEVKKQSEYRFPLAPFKCLIISLVFVEAQDRDTSYSLLKVQHSDHP